MTALAGFWSFDGLMPRPKVARMARSQSIYGSHSRDWSDSQMAMARNLFRLLPEDSCDLAPQVGGDGALALVADVRLDNRNELADALSLPSERLPDMCDSALLLRALEAWGEGALDRLVGDFAFALWDSREQRLLLARDFLGQRPLHYHRAAGFFAFASMPKGLHALPEVPLAPNAEAVAAFLALIPENGTETFFAGIEKVPAGHVMIVTRERQSLRRYWEPAVEPLRLRRASDYEEAVRAELDRAVAVRLRGAGATVAAHLSAGLDSSAIAATAARAMARCGTVVGYTAVPREGYEARLPRGIADEGPLASAVAARYDNLEHVLVPASDTSPLDQLDRNFHAFQRPFLNLCNGNWLNAIHADAHARGLSVLLTGQSGNMSFSYDGMATLSQMLAQGRLAQLARTAASLLGGGTRLGTVGAQAIGPFLPLPMWQAIGRFRGKGARLTDHSLISQSLTEGLTKAAAERRLDASYRPRGDPVELRCWALQRVDGGNYNKGVLGSWGIDLRHPAADRRLVELCLAIPAEQFLAGGVPRSLARRALADRLPAALVRERRKGYQAADWHEPLTARRGQLAAEAERIARTAGADSLIDTVRMRELIDHWPEGEWHSEATTQTYRLALLRGISAGHFMRKASASNA